jgi:hypothetical protein
MIADTIGSYPVVRCRQCNEPIPVPTRVLNLQNEIENTGTDLVFAFTVRCDTCEAKEVHVFGEIQRFEGEPMKRGPNTRAVGASQSQRAATSFSTK